MIFRFSEHFSYDFHRDSHTFHGKLILRVLENKYHVIFRVLEYFSYIAVSGLPLEAYHATISIEKNKTKSIKVTWESYFAAKTTKAEFDEFVEFLSNFYAQSLKNLSKKF